MLRGARASGGSEVPSDGDLNPEERLRDVHAKVLDIWQEVRGRPAPGGGGPDAPLYAACQVRPSSTLDASEPRVSGLVLFRQLDPGARLDALLALDGFPAEAPNGSSHAVHVHQFGDLSRGCESAGPHYNPRAVPHPLHPGDFGNFAVRDGGLWKHRSGLAASLSGPLSIVGRALVVHAGEDDLGRGGSPASLEHGNAGRRLACCVLGWSGPAPWARLALELAERRKRRREAECRAA